MTGAIPQTISASNTATSINVDCNNPNQVNSPATTSLPSHSFPQTISQSESDLKKRLQLAVKYSSNSHTFMPITQTFTNRLLSSDEELEKSTKEPPNPLLNARYRKHTYPNGDIYEGEFKDGKRNGEGTMTYYGTRNTYKGTWKDDQQNGKGAMDYYDYTSPTAVKTYDGLWKDGQYHGEGVLCYYNHCRCVGNFSQGKFLGTIEYDSGMKYQGDYIETDRRILRHGKGKNIRPDGLILEGVWGNGLFIKGSMKGKNFNGDSYEGEAETLDKTIYMHGRGKLIFADGVIYDGVWFKDSFQEGFCKFSVNNEFYEGQAKLIDGKLCRYGQGRSFKLTGLMFDGLWEKDIFIKGHANYLQSDNTIYTGAVELINNIQCRHGQGKAIFLNGDIQDGTWSEDLFQEGFWKFKNNVEQYEGQAKRILSSLCKHGIGKSIYSDGKILDGKWHEGKFVSPHLPPKTENTDQKK